MTALVVALAALAGLMGLAVFLGRALQAESMAKQQTKLITQVAINVAQTSSNIAGLSDDELRRRLCAQSGIERLPVGAADQSTTH
jgi:hypothetical protein